MADTSHDGLLARWTTTMMMEVLRKLRYLRTFFLSSGVAACRDLSMLCVYRRRTPTLNSDPTELGIWCRVSSLRISDLGVCFDSHVILSLPSLLFVESVAVLYQDFCCLLALYLMYQRDMNGWNNVFSKMYGIAPAFNVQGGQRIALIVLIFFWLIILPLQSVFRTDELDWRVRISGG
jgi:hypothetical protein